MKYLIMDIIVGALYGAMIGVLFYLLAVIISGSEERYNRTNFNHRMKMNDCKISEMINENPKCYICKDDIKVCYE